MRKQIVGGAARRIGRHGRRPAMIAQQGGDRDRQCREDFRRLAVFRQARQREADAFDKGPPARLRQPLAEPLESPHAPGTQPRAHRVAIQPLAGEPLPQQPDRAVIAEARDEVGQRMAAHPQNAARAVAVAQHRLGGDEPGETAVELFLLRIFHAHPAVNGAAAAPPE